MNHDCGDSWSGNCGDGEPDVDKLPPMQTGRPSFGRTFLMKKALLILLLVLACGAIYAHAEIRFIGCVALARLTDPAGVRTDGLCYFEYLLRDS